MYNYIYVSIINIYIYMCVYVGRIFDMSIFLNWLLQHIMCIYIYLRTNMDG